MVHVLETGLEILNNDNPGGLPSVKGWNIISGQLTQASDGSTFTSTNPANLSDTLLESSHFQVAKMSLPPLTLHILHSQHGLQLLRPQEDRSLATWVDY